MIVYVPGRMPRYTAYASAARLGAYQPGYLGQLLPSPPASPPQQLQLLQPQPGPIFAGWPRTMPQDEEMLAATAGHHARLAGTVVANGPPSPAHSDSDASSSSLELGSVRRGEHAQLKCRWFNCGNWFSSLDEMSRHVTKHHSAPGPRGLFYCGWEGCQRGERGFNARYKMLVHVRTHTNEKPHGCTQCLKRFSRAENLKIHARSHTGERPYVCPVEGCNKAYSNSSDRFKHTRTHAVDKPYCCKVPGCSKRYTDPSSLRKHVKTYRHYVNNNDDRRQEKTSYAGEDAPMPLAPALASQERATPEKRSAASPELRSEADKRDSSNESNTTSLSHCSISESPKAISSTSFEEQQKLVEWNNAYNLQERNKEQLQETQATGSSSSPSSLSLSLSSSKSSFEHEVQAGLYNRSSMYDEHHHLSALKPQPTGYPVEMKHCPMASPPDRLLAATPRMGMQSTPIKSEDKASGVDYRNIESIINSSSSSGSASSVSTPLKREACLAGDIVRNSVIKRADAHLQSEQPAAASAAVGPCSSGAATPSECCCRHKCCRHAENDSLLEKSKILSDLILKSQNPLFRHLLASVDLEYGQYGLQSVWPGGQQPAVPEVANTCAQDLRARSAECLPVDMDQDLPLDLTINK